MKIHSIPAAAPSDIIEWSRNCGIKVDGHSFNPDRIPQLIEPMRAMIDPAIRNGTLIKPVQTGGSTVGEILMAFWLSFWHGLLQFNWQDDLRATERWHSRIVGVLRSVKDLKWSGRKYDEKICDASFINSRLLVQGVLASGALDSETVPMQINEEVHLWSPGTLGKARRRQTLVWNSKALDISNAGLIGDQLEAAYEDGSMEVWEVQCLGCHQFHEMRFRWNDRKPELGGLRFDTGAGRTASGKYSLNKVVPTIRYQMPCGFIVHDTPIERRALVGRYRKTNDGALDYKRSWTYEAVSVSEIKWPEVVGEWLTACKAIKAGDMEQMKRFIQERECRFYSESDVPFMNQIILNTAVKKNREGLRKSSNFAGRFGIADWQQGYKAKGELTHYWGACEDILQNCNSQIVWEGMIATDAELSAQWDELEIPNENRFVDCSKNTADILSMCYRDGMNALSGIVSHKGSFLHKDKVRRWYSEPKFIYKERNLAPKYPEEFYQDRQGEIVPGFREPFIIEYNKAGLLANFFFLRDMKAQVLKNNPKAGVKDYIERLIPGDVSEEFQEQSESWERITTRQKKTNDDVEGFRKVRRADHFLMVLAYFDLIKEFSGLLGDQLSVMGLRLPQNENQN